MQIHTLHSWCDEQECMCCSYTYSSLLLWWTGVYVLFMQIHTLHSWCDEQECMCCSYTCSSLLVWWTEVYVLFIHVFFTPGVMNGSICIVQIRITHSWCMCWSYTYSSLLVWWTGVYVLLRYVFFTSGGMRVHILFSTLLLVRLVRRLSKKTVGKRCKYVRQSKHPPHPHPSFFSQLSSSHTLKVCSKRMPSLFHFLQNHSIHKYISNDKWQFKNCNHLPLYPK